MDTEPRTCFPIRVVIFVSSGFSSRTQIDWKSNNGKILKKICWFVLLTPKGSSLSKLFSWIRYTFLGYTFVNSFTTSSEMLLHIGRSAEECVTIRTSKRRKVCSIVAHVANMVLLYLSNCAVDSYFCTLRLASSPIMFSNTFSKSYSKILRVTRSSTSGRLFMGFLWNWLGLSPSFLLTSKLKNVHVFSTLTSVQTECKSTKKTQVVNIWLCWVLFKSKIIVSQ